jgi:hypothetical protein
VGGGRREEDSEGGKLPEELPEKYVQRLQIPENMRKLLSDVTRTLLNTGTITKEQVEMIIGQFDRGAIGVCLKG